MKKIFFPLISRRSSYSVKPDGSYYVYGHYRDHIFEDCGNRCVYCDVTLQEAGYEGFALDHFRPQEHYPRLCNDPTNLVAACSRCNRLKSSHWPAGVTSNATHDGKMGFVDPFGCDRHDYFEITEKGEISVKQPPSAYFIGLLDLNRPSRRWVRRQRLLRYKCDDILERIEKLIQRASQALSDGVDQESAAKDLSMALHLIRELKRINKDDVSSLSIVKNSTT